jgi:hypothetical protein
MHLDMHWAKRCAAKTRSGKPCQSPAMATGRCRMHGGPSPGAPKERSTRVQARTLFGGSDSSAAWDIGLDPNSPGVKRELTRWLRQSRHR